VPLTSDSRIAPDPTITGQERGPVRRALAACLVAVVITGGALAGAASAAAASSTALIAGGGGAAAGVIIVAVTAAIYYAEMGRLGTARALLASREAARLDREAASARQDAESARRDAESARQDAESARQGAESARRDAESARQEAVSVRQNVVKARNDAAIAVADRLALETEAARLAGETVPEAISRMRQGEEADTALAEAGRSSSQPLNALLEIVMTEIAAAERRGTSTMAACANAAARIQAQTTRMLSELREMEQRYGDDKVFGDLMDLDHRVSQMGRLADSVALLAGGRSGRRWTKPIPMESVLRGAMGRIDAYQRIQLHLTTSDAVVSYAAEGVMHALAELMDNATAFSAHGSEVHVYAEEEDVGIVVTIDDSGLGMRRRERARAEGLVSSSFDLSTLPGTRLGLAVVGRVAARHGLSVSFRPSSRGGTGVVVMIPRALITLPREVADAPFRELAAAASPTVSSATVPSDGDETDDSGTGFDSADSRASVGDLPVRPRGRTLAAATRGALGVEEAPRARSARDAGSRFAAFRQSGQSSRAVTPGGDTAGNAATEN
jgi:signal transduction histidine kinase